MVRIDLIAQESNHQQQLTKLFKVILSPLLHGFPEPYYAHQNALQLLELIIICLDSSWNKYHIHHSRSSQYGTILDWVHQLRLFSIGFCRSLSWLFLWSAVHLHRSSSINCMYLAQGCIGRGCWCALFLSGILLCQTCPTGWGCQKWTSLWDWLGFWNLSSRLRIVYSGPCSRSACVSEVIVAKLWAIGHFCRPLRPFCLHMISELRLVDFLGTC